MNAESLQAYPLATWRESFGVAETPAEYVFHRPRLYLDTTIPSYLTARISRDLKVARMQRITSRWWNSWRTQFDIHVSRLVITEARKGDREAAERRMSVIERFPELPADPKVIRVPFCAPLSNYWRDTNMLCPDEDDEIMAEVRRMRDAYAAEFGYDRRKMLEAHMRHQAEFPHLYVSFNKNDPNCVPDTFRYEDFFKRHRPDLESVPLEPTDGEE